MSIQPDFTSATDDVNTGLENDFDITPEMDLDIAPEKDIDIPSDNDFDDDANTASNDDDDVDDDKNLFELDGSSISTAQLLAQQKLLEATEVTVEPLVSTATAKAFPGISNPTPLPDSDHELALGILC
jgi:hypothetical protein